MLYRIVPAFMIVWRFIGAISDLRPGRDESFEAGDRIRAHEHRRQGGDPVRPQLDIPDSAKIRHNSAKRASAMKMPHDCPRPIISSIRRHPFHCPEAVPTDPPDWLVLENTRGNPPEPPPSVGERSRI